MDEEHHLIGLLIKMINDALHREVNNEMRPQGMTMSQMRALTVLDRSDGGELSLKQLEMELGAAQPTVWGLVSRLEAKGLVSTWESPDDARAKQVGITAAGREQCATAYRQMLEYEQRLTQCLTREEASQLASLLERVWEGFTHQP